MSKYRDDLDAAKYRIVDLEERLLDREKEIAELRRKAEEKLNPPPHKLPEGSTPRIAAIGLGIITLSTSAIMALRKPDPPTQIIHGLPNLTVANELSPLGPPVIDTSRIHSEAKPSVAPPNPRRPDECVARHGYTDLKSLPGDTLRVALDKCDGCSCCSPSGDFESAFLGDTGGSQCAQCANELALDRAGISIAGVTPTPHGSLATNDQHVVRVAFDSPVSVFALRVEPAGLRSSSNGGSRRATVSLVGFDAQDRVTDVSVASYDPTFSGTIDRAPDFALRSRFLAVESCDGRTLTHAELRLSDANMTLDNLAIDPPIHP